jgi:hypothetical protein
MVEPDPRTVLTTAGQTIPVPSYRFERVATMILFHGVLSHLPA